MLSLADQFAAPPAVRRATPGDAAGIAAVMTVVTSERVHSAIDHAWPVEEERRYLQALSPREAVHVAVDATENIVGLQILDRWSSILESMAHVGQVATFVVPEWRGRGIGSRLWSVTETFAREAGYRKLVIAVRSSNAPAQHFYRRHGFHECGRLKDQVVIDDTEDDEILMELFFARGDYVDHNPT
jgi:ribosomal protein S18 acetylase RimI-like enzyme